ncbi:MAG: LamG domain-containing protein [Ginsengibacter sp.]
MKFYRRLLIGLATMFVASLVITSCQKLERPALGELILDPGPPTLQILGANSYWPFDGTSTDTGQNQLSTTTNNISFVPGVTYVLGVTGGSAAQIGTSGYVLAPNLNSSLKAPGSLSLAFWMNGAPGPIQGGAQGIFAISNSTQFWGNLEIFLENYSDPTDPNAVFMKIHMFNANVTGGGEEWIQDDNVKLTNVLGKWTHIALTYDAATSQLTLYKDGAPTGVNNMVLGGGTYGDLKFDDASGMVLGSFAFQTNPSLTTHGPETWAKSFNGALDQFRIYTKALSAAEVKNLYDNKL